MSVINAVRTDCGCRASTSTMGTEPGMASASRMSSTTVVVDLSMRLDLSYQSACSPRRPHQVWRGRTVLRGIVLRHIWGGHEYVTVLAFGPTAPPWRQRARRARPSRTRPDRCRTMRRSATPAAIRRRHSASFVLIRSVSVKGVGGTAGAGAGEVVRELSTARPPDFSPVRPPDRVGVGRRQAARA